MTFPRGTVRSGPERPDFGILKQAHEWNFSWIRSCTGPTRAGWELADRRKRESSSSMGTRLFVGNLLASTIPFTQGNLASPMYLLDGVACDHSDDIPDNEFLLWNPNYYIVNVSKNITVSVNTSIYENKDQTAWYAKIYAGGRILFPAETVKHRIPTI